jgi:hypothetical protein
MAQTEGQGHRVVVAAVADLSARLPERIRREPQRDLREGIVTLEELVPGTTNTYRPLAVDFLPEQPERSTTLSSGGKSTASPPASR